ncbi:MAG: preprotein translocase subunit SecG [Sedimentisphaerales bacterium]|nr:preprotein translocase subunit SecG [Sedimentisphaerales bacterium]
MNNLSFLAVTFVMNIVAVLFIICSLALVFIILLQKGRGGGLSSAFGGGMASGILGSKTGDFLTWVTIALVGIFLILAVLMARFYMPTASRFGQQPQSQPAVPTAPERRQQPAIPITDSGLAETTDVNQGG